MKHDHTPSNPARPLSAAGAPVLTCTSGDAPDKTRHDGWTLEKQRRFCEVLAECGVVERAADAVGMSRRSAYAFRNRSWGRAFAAVWDQARAVACRAVVDEAVTLAFQGRVVQVIEDGQIVRERRHNSPARLLRAVERLRSGAVLGDAIVVAASHDFERCLDLLGKGLAFPVPAPQRKGVQPELMDIVRYQILMGEDVPERPAPLADDEPQPEVMPPATGPHRWSPAVQRDFCEALSRCGSVDKACRAVGKGRSGAYALRLRPEGRAFAIAWDAALLVVSEEMMDLALELAIEGSVDTLYKLGKLVRVRRVMNVDQMLGTVARISAMRLPGGGASLASAAAGFSASLDRLETGEALDAIEAGNIMPVVTPEIIDAVRAAIFEGCAL